MIPIRPWRRFLSVAIFVFAVDRMTKILAIKFLAEGGSLPVLPKVFHLTLVFNTGAAFGFLKDQQLFFILISIFAVAFIIHYLWKHQAAGFVSILAFGLITGGTVGNLFDRIRYGHVIDFLDFRIWPVFNIADSAITIGAMLLVWLVLLRTNN